ncbi:hypothetical protein MSBRW_3278 [Methanosarcina barkeri str. Wiesmoor]|uniref:Uncharacterized protein n=1 Tax=Methanosarcina barkeri str. Wiesmoor TaxID=1434109 RepID=A0A0E3LM75_METBA|nr:DUF3160 domain-containing protein [Methanosarcina barkeri]AKB52531.1 hypothetical protein MSBRW_3278 [Methanosarcina barkeri str. Wiesmoor]
MQLQTEVWEDKQLGTVFVPLTELKHDNYFYAKKAYFTGVPSKSPEEKPVQIYRELVPEFNFIMLALTKMAYSGLATMEVLGEQSSKDSTPLEMRILYLNHITG